MTSPHDPAAATPATTSAAPAPELPGEVPDLPAGIGGLDPETPLQYTREDLDAATALLERAGTERAGTEDPELIVSLTDEQIAALDGYARRQFIAAPWLEQHPQQRRFAAGVALRGLIAAEQVRRRTDEATGAQHWRAVPEISGCLVLRRTAQQFTTAERTVQTAQGPQVHRLHYFAHPGGVLEEEVTAAGIHRFTALAPVQASARLAAFLDPLGVPTRAGEPVRVRTSVLPAHPLAERLAATRALSVLTRVRTADGEVQQLSAYATAEGVLTMEALDPGTEDPELEIRGVDAAELHALASVLVSAEPQRG
ncbi:hypothetical protein [Brachybacterium massiliense]|uniref:hypothetical protein n=1 Tax=Brachybacterium massiliense TaxID=1755098 RepID=UPI000B3BD309|nr:hypothetical protein [Brachybacterium massiliense]